MLCLCFGGNKSEPQRTVVCGFGGRATRPSAFLRHRIHCGISPPRPAAEGPHRSGKVSLLVAGLLSQLLYGIFEFFGLHFTPNQAYLGQGIALSWSHSIPGMWHHASTQQELDGQPWPKTSMTHLGKLSQVFCRLERNPNSSPLSCYFSCFTWEFENL